jgi:hypothetical protein
MECGGEEGVVFMGVAFRELPGGRSGGDYLSRAIVDCKGAPMRILRSLGLTSCRWITIAGTLARPATPPPGGPPGRSPVRAAG